MHFHVTLGTHSQVGTAVIHCEMKYAHFSSLFFSSLADIHKYAHGRAHRQCCLFKSSGPSVSLCALFFSAFFLKTEKKESGLPAKQDHSGALEWGVKPWSIRVSLWNVSKPRTPTVI